MTVSIQMKDFGKLQALMNALGPSNRQRLNAVGAKALEVAVRSHVAQISASRHSSAGRLGASPTGHYRKGMRGIAGHATAQGGEVVVPIAGISRAYHDVDIEPVRANRLTIPINAISYGHTAKELSRRGWKFFTPPKGHDKEDILFGYKGKGKGRIVKPLFLLKTIVHQRQDPSLLPSQYKCAAIVARAMTAEVNRRIANAR